MYDNNGGGKWSRAAHVGRGILGRMTFWRWIVTLAALLGFATFTNVGGLGEVVSATIRTIQLVKPEFQEAGGILKEYSPAVPGMIITIGGQDYVIADSRPAGAEYARLTGVDPQKPSNRSTSSQAQISDGLAMSVDELQEQFVIQADDNEQAANQFEELKQQFLLLTGGGAVPNFSNLKSVDVISLRQLLAAMRAVRVAGSNLPFDMVTPSQWEAMLEQAVQNRFIECFATQNLQCVKEWGKLQTEFVSNPPGLSDWLDAIIADVDQLTELATVASGSTDINNMIAQKIAASYEAAITSRKNRACQSLNEGLRQPIDFQWCFSGQSGVITVDEGFQLPSTIFGNRGNLDSKDTIVLKIPEMQWETVLSYEEAMTLFPRLTVQGGNIQFPNEPSLWDKINNPWFPGGQLP